MNHVYVNINEEERKICPSDGFFIYSESDLWIYSITLMFLNSPNDSLYQAVRFSNLFEITFKCKKTKGM